MLELLETYRGYTLERDLDVIAIMQDGVVIDVARKIDEARKIIDDWHNAR